MFKRFWGAQRSNDDKEKTQDQVKELFDAATQLFSAQTWSEAKRILQENSNLLLTERGDEFFYVLERQMVARGDQHLIPIAEDCRKLIASCRDKGIEQSFNELPKHTRSEIYAAVRELLHADSQETQAKLVRKTPQLFADKRAEECFLEIAAAAVRHDDKEYAQYVVHTQTHAGKLLAGDSKEENAPPPGFPDLDIDVVRAFRQLLRSEQTALYENLKEREKTLTAPAAIELVKLMMSLEYQTKNEDQRDNRVFAIGELVISASEEGCDAAYARYRAKQAVRALFEAISEAKTPLEFKNAVEPQCESLLSEAATAYVTKLLADTDKKSGNRVHLEVVSRFLEAYRKEGAAVFDKFFDESSKTKEELERLLSEWEADQEIRRPQ